MRHAWYLHPSRKIHGCRSTCRLSAALFLRLNLLVHLECRSRGPIFKETCRCDRSDLRGGKWSLYLLELSLLSLLEAVRVAFIRGDGIFPADFSFDFNGWLWCVHLKCHFGHPILIGVVWEVGYFFRFLNELTPTSWMLSLLWLFDSMDRFTYFELPTALASLYCVNFSVRVPRAENAPLFMWWYTGGCCELAVGGFCGGTGMKLFTSMNFSRFMSLTPSSRRLSLSERELKAASIFMNLCAAEVGIESAWTLG